MKKNTATVFITLLPCLAIAQAQQFVIDGKIASDTIATGKIYLAYEDNGQGMRDSAVLVNNTYHFAGAMQDGAIKANISWEDRTKGVRDGRMKGFVQFYTIPGKVKVTNASVARFHNATITGSPVQQDADQFAAIWRLHQKPDDELEADFIKAHPASWYSFELMEQRWIRSGKMTVDEADELYSVLTPALKKYKRVQAFKALVNGRRAAVVGKPAPLFGEKDTNGKLVKLTDYKGKYVLVDFWASWCHPCRAENPNVTAAYHKYKEKGLNILSVSLDGNRKSWLEAVAHDKLEWTQVSNLKAFDDEAAVKYGVHAIPSNFLVDPNGIIIGKNLMGKELEEKLAEVFH